MRPIALTRFAYFLLATAFATTTLTAQEPLKPTEEHKVLAQDVGKWNTKVEIFMPGSEEPLMSTGTEVNEAVCNGLFVQSMFKGDVAGMPFEGRGLMGYDAFKKMYTGVWVDNFGSSLYPMEGTWDAAKKTMTVKMTGPDPTSGKPMTMKLVTTWIDADNKTFEMFGPDPTGQSDGMMKMMSMKATRQK